MMYKAYLTGGGDSSPSFKAWVKKNIETRSVCVCMHVYMYMYVCVCMCTCVHVGVLRVLHG